MTSVIQMEIDMSIDELDLVDWKTLAAEYKEKNPDLGYWFIMPWSMIAKSTSVTMKQLCGEWVVYSGHRYKSVMPRETNLRIGSPLHHLAVEQKFYEWVKNNRAPKMKKPKPIGAPEQGSLF